MRTFTRPEDGTGLEEYFHRLIKNKLNFIKTNSNEY